MGRKIPEPSRQTTFALDGVNFLMADVHNAVGPFLAIYLTASLHWKPADIGIAISAASIAGLVAQTPAGALIDRLRHKREALVVGTIVLGLGALAIVWRSSFAEIISVLRFPTARAASSCCAPDLTPPLFSSPSWRRSGSAFSASSCPKQNPGFVLRKNRRLRA